MQNTLTACPNCNTSLKSGFMSSIALVDDYKTKVINTINNTDTAGYCTKCESFSTAYNKLTAQIEETKKLIWQAMGNVPVVSAQSPLNWDYDVLTMVTGQSTTGTGVIAEFTSSWTDLFGAQSGTYNKKLKAGEDMCFQQLRKQALEMGGNAVIATDIDYSEVGGDKGMLMVCMAGTAVRLKNVDVLGENRVAALDEINSLSRKLRTLQQLEKAG